MYVMQLPQLLGMSPAPHFRPHTFVTLLSRMDVLIPRYCQTIRQGFLGWSQVPMNSLLWLGINLEMCYLALLSKRKDCFEYNITIHVCIFKKGPPF